MRGFRIAGIVSGLLLAGGAAPALAREPVPGAAEDPGGCSPAQLDVRLDRVDPGAGNRYAPLVFTNGSGAGCTLRGHPALVVLDASGDPLPGGVLAVEGPGETVTLEPGGSARAVLHWTVTADDCPDASALLVTPPGQGAATTLPFPAGRVCGALDVTPVR
ncbi:DUF4232 domain-containing protein [Nonomuraea muscovyensis]|uniref:DUF4232 domain-containing protein n=1 Tax=Nonomuraea muscovyensis TaxID=1124761 RepID=A0A7X0CB54_9ACTN|nr:DUF4232 domain-containing protein [Nonomuraea muscovyensis]MBB6351413.1 hypothetical protein [Nonomuraea muscovyensis]